MESDFSELDGSSDPQLAAELLQQRYNYLTNLTDYSKIDQILASTFPLEDGILGFIVCNSGKKEQEKSKLLALQIIHWLLTNDAIDSNVWPLCQRIQKVVDILWRNSRETSKVQASALENMILLLENFKEAITVENFELAKLYFDLLPASEKSSFTPTVRGKMFHCLGVIASFGSHKFLEKEERYMQLLRHFVAIITSQIESNYSHMEASILLGCIRGLEKFLTAFQNKISKDCPEIKSFYVNLEKIIDPKCSIENDDQSVKLNRREFQRAGLDFVASHGTFFFENFYENHDWWFMNLLSWAKSSNSDDLKVGMKAVMKFIETVCLLTDEQTQNTVNQEKMQKFLKFFTTIFTTILENKDCHRSELTVAVKGSGLLAKICGDPNIVEQLFNKIVKQIDAIIIELNMPVVDKYSGSHSLIPTYLESVGDMLLAMNISDEESRQNFQNRLVTVENLSILLITVYPDLAERRKPYAPKCFTTVVKGLYGRHYKYCEPFLERVVHEGLTHIIASHTQAEADILIEAFNLQNANRKSNDGGKTKSVYTRLGIKTVYFYTSFWTGLIEGSHYADVKGKDKLVYNAILDWILKTIEKLDLSLQFPDENDDPEEAGEVNMADFAYNSRANVVKDFQLFINIVNFLSTFVKNTNAQLFEDWVELFIEKIFKYLKDHTLVSGFYRILDLVFEMTRKLNYFESPEKRDILKHCCHFLESTSLKMQEFRDDLLLAILDVWLSAPDPMILKSYSSLGETLECVFRTGRNCFPLAFRGIQAIERWFQIQDFPEEEMEKLMKRLFPFWKLYFSTKEDEPEAQIETVATTYKSKSRFRQRRMKALSTELKEITLRKLQLEILRIVGSYAHLINVDEDVDADLDNFYSYRRKGFIIESRFLEYAVPFQDIKPDFYLDDFLPGLLEICHTASDRQLRSTACEVFHAVVLYFIGHCSNFGKLPPLELRRRIFQSVIKLGCDSDPVINQLFNPLALQAIRWYTAPNAKEFGQTLLRIIIDGLVQSEDPSKRDFCEICLQAYFTYCLKYSRQDILYGKNVMKHLLALSQHASSQYRQGSVHGFNSIYRDFREHKHFPNQYCFQFVYSYIINLALSNDFDETSMLVRTTKQALQHLERIIIHKKESFNINLSGREVPSEFEGPVLKNLVDWLFKKGAKSGSYCRKECFRLIESLAPCVKGIGSVQNYMSQFESKAGSKELLAIAENCFETAKDNQLTYDAFVDCIDITSDFYSFIKKEGYPVEVLIKREDSQFVQQLVKFLDNFETEMQNYDTDTSNIHVKALSIFCSIGFLDNILSPDTEARIIALSAWVSARDSEKNPVNIRSIVDTWKKLWKSCGTSDILLEFGPKLHEIFDLQITDELNTNRVIWLKNVAQDRFLKEMWNQSKILTVLDAIWKFIDDKLFERCRTGLEERLISNRVKNLIEALFSLAVELGMDQGDLIVGKLFDPTIVEQQQRVGGRILKTTKGDIFQKFFVSYLPQCPKMLDFTKLKETVSMEKLGLLVQKLLVEIKNKKHLKHQFGTIIVEKTIQIWKYLALNCSSFVVSGLISALASLNMNLCRNSEELADWWCGSSMMTDVNTTLREKSEFIHFLGLFGLSKKLKIVNKVMSTLYDLLERSLNATLSWRDEENYLLKIFHAILTVFDKIPRNREILNIIVLFTSKVAEISSSDSNSCSLLAKRKLEQIVLKMENNMEGQLSLANGIYTLLVAEGLTYMTNTAPTKFCLLPVITSLSEGAVKEFYKKNIKDLITKGNVNSVSILEWNLKITIFNLLESLVLLKTSKLFFTSPELNCCYIKNPKPTEEKKLSKDVAALCTKLKLPATGGNDVIRRTILKCNQAAYNALVGALIKMVGAPSAICKIAIVMASVNGQWTNIIDCDTEYKFPVIFDKVTNTEDSDSSMNSMENFTNDSLSVKKVAIQLNSAVSRKNALAASSLAIDATNYDFTAAVTVNDSKYYQKIFGSAATAPTTTTSGRHQYPSGDSSEWNHVNQHDCMFSFTQCLRYLAKRREVINKLLLIQLESNQLDTPDWINGIKDYLRKPTIHQNIKLFFIGAILNCKDIFKVYAREFMEPIINIILPNQQCFGPELNYFLKDVLVMLLEWNEVTRPSTDLVKKLLDFIISKIYHDRKDVYYQNLQIVEAIVKMWVSPQRDEIPFQIISEKLSEFKPRLGLDLCKHVLRGEFLPCKNDLMSLQNVFKLVGKCFSSTSKPIYLLGGDVAGLLFSKLQDLNSEHLDDAISLERQFLDKEKKSRPAVFLTILNGVQKYYPTFALHYKGAILELLKTNHKTEALKLLPNILRSELDELHGGIISSETITENFFADLEGRGLFRIVCKNDEEAIAGLELLEQLVDSLHDESKILQVINWIEKTEYSSDVKIQVRYAQGISKIFFQFGGRREQKPLSTKAMKLFVKLLKDDQEDMREVTNDFWEKNLKRCNDTPSLILELMEILGDDQGAVPICVNLIMKRCSLSPDYMKDIFKPLSDDKEFTPYDVNTSWRKRYSAYQPLYAESLSSSQNFSKLPDVLRSAVFSQRQGSGKMNLLMATLKNPQFSLTAPTSEHTNSLNLTMNQSSLASFNPGNFFGDFKPEYLTETTQNSQDRNNNVLTPLRKRFYGHSTQYYAQRRVERQEAVVESEVEDVRKKKSGINLVRSYRIGEIPDVVIKHMDFLNTISSLTKMDEEMGRKFLVHLFTNMVKEISKIDAKKGSKFCRDATKSFNMILQKFVGCISPQFAGTILEIAAVNNLFLDSNAQEKSAIISIKPGLISETSRNFHLHRLAILQLEGLLGSSKVAEGPEVKRPRIPGTENNETDLLLRIAELYKDLENFDDVRNVFSMAGKASVESAEKYNQGSKGLLLENDGKFHDALEVYSSLWNQEQENPENYNERRAQFWDVSVYKCLKQLSNWEAMFERTETYQAMHGIDGEKCLQDLTYLNNILPHQVTSGIQILVRDQSPETDEPPIVGQVKNFLEEMKKKEENWQFVVDEYPTDFAVLSAVFHHDYGRIEFLLDKSFSKSLEKFQNFDKFSQPQKKEHLLKLQRSSALQDYLRWYKLVTITRATPDDIEDSCFKVIAKWKHSGKSRTSSLVNSEIMVAQKDYFLTTMAQFVDNDANAMLESKDHIIREFQCINSEQHLWLAKLCVLNGNSDMARSTFDKVRSIGDQLDEICHYKIHQLRCEFLIAFTERPEWCKIWTSTWKNLRIPGTIDEASLWEIKSDLLRSLFSKLSCGPLPSENKFRRTLELDAEENLSQFTMDEAICLAQTVMSSEVYKNTSHSSLHMKLYKLLNVIKDKSISDEENIALQEYLLISLLRGMSSGDSEALHLFPNIFSMLKEFPQLVPTFQELVKNVPTWMFLPWLDQIVTNWKHNENLQNVFNPIIDRLLIDYPQAFQLQYANILKRKNLSTVSVMYAEALNAVVVPSNFFKNYIDSCEAALTPLQPEKLVLAFHKFKQKLIEVRNNTDIYGDVHTNYAHKILPKIESYEKILQDRRADNGDMDDDDSSSSQSTIDDYSLAKSFFQELKNLRKQLEEKRQNRDMDLESLSPWLFKFRSFLYQDYLEVPGLYTKFEKPNLEYHPKVVSFHPVVWCLRSITKPIRITMRCDNGKEVHFLIKKGDDLNQDKRIQQCFQMANEIFQSDTHCRERNMRILTYSVIPFTNDFGMIQWIDKTIPMKELILKGPKLTETCNSSLNFFNSMMMNNFAPQKYVGRTKLKVNYHIYAEQIKRAEAESMFDRCKSMLPQGLMRKHVMEGCSSLEDYFVIREKMIRSYATLCFVHWILGIGDRHLENCLVSHETGEFLGIDFGRSFGVSIHQHVPELIPFRLTPQIQDFLLPYGYNGIFKEILIYAKRSMEKSNLMSSCVDVFTQDPLVDWLQHRVHSESEESKANMSVIKKNWMPLKVVNMKLNGENPLDIIKKDLENLKSELQAPYTNVLTDGKNEVMDHHVLTDEEYVNSLISIATDKQILIRMFSGWCSWI